MSAEQFVGTIEQVQFHEPDPKAENGSDPWDEVSAQFRSLGDSLKNAYRKAADEGGPSEDEIKSAFATLAGAWDQVAESFGDALRDPETRDRIKEATSSFATALGATLADLGREIGRDGTDDADESPGV